jgi:hypothetical protein
MRSFVAVVICAIVALPAGAAASTAPRKLVRDASRLTGLAARKPVTTSAVTAARYGALYARARTRDYPAGLRRTDATLYDALGLGAVSVKRPLPRAWYDIAARKIFVQRRPAAARRTVLQEVARALIDQNFGLKRRLAGLRTRDRDRWLAANAIVDGTAALASGLRPGTPHGTPLDRFYALDGAAGLGAGRALAAQLRYLGGRGALLSALRTFPQTTEQLLHVDKFLERERALPISLPAGASGTRLVASATFGELELRNLLRAFDIASADTTAEGWGGGKLALYDDGSAVLVVRWDTPEDAAEWQAAVPRYVAAAFPGAVARTCPPLDRCWTAGATNVAAGVYGTRSVFASGPSGELIAAGLLR